MTTSSEVSDERPVESADDDAPGLFSDRAFGRILTVGSAIALLASFTLMRDEIELLRNPEYDPACNFSILMNCGSVMMSEQGAVFGFPNPLLGIVGFALLLAIGVAAAAGTRFPRWYWVGTLAGLTFAFGMVNWFAYQAIFVMGVLCPWCMVVWTMTVPMFWYGVLHTVGKFTNSGLLRGLRAWHLLPVFLWFLVVITLIFVWFWDYYWEGFFAGLFG